MTDFASPYARTLGLSLAREAGRLIVTMPPADGTLGRPGFLHGGAISGLLDYAAWATLVDAVGPDVRVKPITIAVDFMRGGKLVDSYARADLIRVGRRVANVAAFAWQEDETKPIAAANLKFILERR